MVHPLQKTKWVWAIRKLNAYAQAVVEKSLSQKIFNVYLNSCQFRQFHSVASDVSRPGGLWQFTTIYVHRDVINAVEVEA